MQPAEAAEFSSPNVLWHQWMVEELQREFGSGTIFVSSARVLGSSLQLGGEKRHCSRVKWHPSIGHYGLLWIWITHFITCCEGQGIKKTDSGGHCFFRQTQQDDASLQELTGSVCAPAALQCQFKPSHCAAASEGPTETRGQLGE